MTIQSSKPTVFIGSSREGLEIARSIKSALEPELEIVIWDQSIFEAGEDILTSLLKFVSVFDFGIFVMTGDDIIKSRRFWNPIPRDNVIFELGLFMGALGRRRAFPIIAPPKKGRLKMPSDLLGNAEIRLSAHSPSDEEIQKITEPLKNTILQRSKSSYLQLLPSTGLAIGYFRNFLIPVCNALSSTEKLEVNGAEIDIEKDNFDFHVILPKSLSGASREGANRFFMEKSLQGINLESQGKGRPYPLHVSAEMEDGRLQLYDYPTTLGASHEAIKVALSSGFLGYEQWHHILDNKEIENFKKTLQILLKEPAAAGFINNIKFTRLSS